MQSKTTRTGSVRISDVRTAQNRISMEHREAQHQKALVASTEFDVLGENPITGGVENKWLAEAKENGQRDEDAPTHQ